MKPNERENKLYKSGKRSKIELEEEIMVNLLGEMNSDDYILDIGSGSGEIAYSLKNRGLKLFCLDFAESALKIAQQEFKLNVVLHDLDRGYLPFRDDSFDAIWAGDIIEHLFDPIFVLNEVSRVLKKNGILLITIPNDLYISNRIKISFGKSYQHSSYIKFSQYKHHTFFSHSLLEYMLQINNLKILRRINLCKLPKTQKFIKLQGSGLITNLFAVIMIYKITKG